MMFPNNSSEYFSFKNYLYFPKKVVECSFIFIIIGIIIICFHISFSHYLSYYVEKEDNLYHTMIPYQEIDIWVSSNNLYYKKHKYHYEIVEIGKEASYQNNIVYLPCLIKIEKLTSNLPILEVTLQNKKITIIDYLKEKFKGG